MSFESAVNDFLWYYRTQEININNVKLNFCHFGKSDNAIIIFSGGLMVKEVWIPYYQKLVSDHQVLLFDYPALNSNLEVAYAIHDLVSFLGISNPVLMAASDGISTALTYAKAYKDEVRGMILLNKLSLFKDEKEIDEILSLSDEEFIEFKRKLYFKTRSLIRLDDNKKKLEDELSFLVKKRVDKDRLSKFKVLINEMNNLNCFSNEDFKGLKVLTTEASLVSLFDDVTFKRLSGGPLNYLVNSEEYLNLFNEFLSSIEDEACDGGTN